MADKNLPAVASIAPVLAAAEAVEARLLSVEGIENVVASTMGEIVLKTNRAQAANVPRLGTEVSVAAAVEAEAVAWERNARAMNATAAAGERSARATNAAAIAQERLNAALAVGRDLGATTQATTTQAATRRATGVRSSSTGVVFGETPTRRTPRTSSIGTDAVILDSQRVMAERALLGGEGAPTAAQVLARTPLSVYRPAPERLALGPGLGYNDAAAQALSGYRPTPERLALNPGGGGSSGGSGSPPPTIPGGAGGGGFDPGGSARFQAGLAAMGGLNSAQLGRVWQNNNADLTRFNNTLTRHGYLTSEVIQAAQRGELTYAEWGQQIAGTAAKFGAWTAVSIPIFGAIDAFRKLYDGAVETSQGIAFMQRSIDNVNAGRATTELQGLSQHFNVSIKDAATAVGVFGRIFHTQAEATAAAPVALYAEKLNNVDVTTAATRFTAIANEFKLPARDLQQVGDQMTQGMLRFGTSIDVSSQALATAGGTWHAAGGDLSTLLALIVTLNRTGAATGTIGTAISQSIVQVQQPKNVGALAALGIRETSNYQQLILDVIAKAKAHPEDITALSQALGNARTTRIFPALLEQPDLFAKVLATTRAGAPGVAGSQERELQHQLSGANEQISRMGVLLENIGSSLLKSGVLNSLGALLQFLNHSLVAVNDLIGAFNSIPNPFRSLTAASVELLLVWKALRAVNIGRGLGAGGTQGLTNADGSLTATGFFRKWLTPDPTQTNALAFRAQAGADVTARQSEYVAATQRVQAATITAERLQLEYEDANAKLVANEATMSAEELEAQRKIVATLKRQALSAQTVMDEYNVQRQLAATMLRLQVDINSQMMALGKNFEAINALARGVEMDAAALPHTGAGGPLIRSSEAAGGAAASDIPIRLASVGTGTKVTAGERGALLTEQVGGVATAESAAVTAARTAPAVDLIPEAATLGPMSKLGITARNAGTGIGNFLGGGSFGGGSGGLMNGFFTYLTGSIIAQLVGSGVGGRAGHTISSLGTDAAIGAGIGAAVPIPGVGPGVGALVGVGAGLLGDLFHGDSAANAKALASLTPGPDTNATGLRKAVNDYYKSNTVANERAIRAAAVANLGSPGTPGAGTSVLNADVAHPGGAAYAYAPYPGQAPGPGFHLPVPQSTAEQQAAIDQKAYNAIQVEQNQQQLGGGTPTPKVTPAPSSLFGDTLAGLTNGVATPFGGAANAIAALPAVKDMPSWLRPTMSFSEMVTATKRQMDQRTIRPGELKPGLDQGVANTTRQREIIASIATPFLAYATEQQVANLTPAGSKARQQATAEANAAVLQLVTAANPQSSAAQQGFLGYYESLGTKYQVPYNSYIKDTLAEQGLATPTGRKFGAQAQIAASFDFKAAAGYAAQSLKDTKPNDRQRDFNAAHAYASEAFSLVSTYLGANNTDLQNALTEATSPQQSAAAFQRAINDLKTEARKNPFAAPEIKAAIVGLKQQRAQFFNTLNSSQVSLADTLDPNAADVMARDTKTQGDIVNRDIAAFGRFNQVTIDAINTAAQKNLSDLQGELSQIQSKGELAVSQLNGDTLAIDSKNLGTVNEQIAAINADRKLTAAQRIQALRPLLAQRNNLATQGRNDTYSHLQALHSGQTALAVANAGADQLAADQANITGAQQAINDLKNSGKPQRVINEQLPGLYANLRSAQTQKISDAYSYAQTLQQGSTALNAANAGNNVIAADQANVTGARQAIANLQSSGLPMRVIASEMPGLLATLRTDETALINDMTDQANAVATGAIQLAAGIGNDPTKIAQGAVAAAKEVLARGHFKHPQDKIAAEQTLQQAQYSAEQTSYDQLGIRLDLSRASVSQQVEAYVNFALKWKGKNKALYDAAMQKVISLENQAAGSYELNVGNGSLLFPSAYQVRRAEHALNYPHNQQGMPWHVNPPKTTKDERPILHGDVNIYIQGAHDPKETARQVATHFNTVMQRNTRASRRSSLIR